VHLGKVNAPKIHHPRPMHGAAFDTNHSIRTQPIFMHRTALTACPSAHKVAQMKLSLRLSRYSWSLSITSHRFDFDSLLVKK